jgi:uridine kinase
LQSTANVATSVLPLVYGKRLDDLDVLARSKLLSGLGIRDLGIFLDLLDQVALPQGTTIIREGDAGEYMYFVLEGMGRLRRGKLELHSIGPGAHFGELALLTEVPRSISVEADTTMRLARLSRSRYRNLATTHPRVALHFTQALATALGEDVVAFTDSVGLLTQQRTAPRRLQVVVTRAGERLVVATGTLAGTLLPRETEGFLVVAATINRRPVTLETAITSDCELEALTLSSWGGRAIYVRSAALVLLEAARRVVPGASVRMGPSLENGQIVVVRDIDDRAALAASVFAEMAKLVGEAMPLREEVWSIDEARSELQARGSHDAAALSLGARELTTTLVTCGGTLALGMGPVLPSASYLGRFTIVPHAEGLHLQLHDLDRYMPAHRGTRIDPGSYESSLPRYAGEMVAASERFYEGLGLHDVGAFNRRCVSGEVPEIVRIAEGFHEKWIGRIADSITGRGEGLAVIAVAGPSSSGKTTFIKRLSTQLLVNGLRPVGLSLDDYYVDRERTVRDESGEFDFEAIEAIDAALLHEQLRQLLAGEEVATARYDFVAGKSLPHGGRRVRLGRGQVLLVEGIHGLAPGLFDGVVARERVFRIFVHPARTLAFDQLNVLAPEDVRLLRRIVRDRHQRNYAAAETLSRWPSVRRGELRHIFPYLPAADAVFDSSLVYELSVTKTYAERYLLEVPPSHAAFTDAHRLRKLLDQFVAIHPDHVPPTSVIREFIGGSGFEY